MARGTRTPLHHDEFEQAFRACAAAARLDPYDPNPWVVRLGLLRQWRRPPTEVFPIWREIVARDPWHREAHLQMYGYLSPRECGSLAQSMDFVDQVRATAPATAPTAGLPLLALIDRYHTARSQGGVQALTADRLWSGYEATRILETAQAAWPEPGQAIAGIVTPSPGDTTAATPSWPTPPPNSEPTPALEPRTAERNSRAAAGQPQGTDVRHDADR
ncbi:hypothetical protein [Streptomyces sp. SP18BB07]|uniref:hypothetical protein n=1 Tax=Streptomyces sp. SP18BB07 TaxID=3002522 RepID=UPI002E75EF5E|nr:hypothetical protein [Streptomyces sp. SP18BB07]MEE1761330.1 hypothetical protein [Streptomyces sp. SP18BB07]